MRLPSRLLELRPGNHHPIVRFDPVHNIERWKENRLELVEVFLSHRLKLVIMALGTLKREPQKRRADDLNRSLEHSIFVCPYLVWIAIALAGTVLPVAE